MNAPTLPLTDPAFWADPYPRLNRLRESTRVARSEDGTAVILRHADVEALLGGGLFRNEGISLLERRGFVPGDPIHTWRSLALGSLHGADHRRIRTLVGRAMGERQMEAITPIVQRHTSHLLDTLGAQPFDAVSAIGGNLPLWVISDYLGIPEDARQRVDDLVRQGLADAFGVEVTPAIRERVNAMFRTLLDFVDGLIEARAMQPRNDLLSGLLNTGDMDERLSREEINVLFLNLFVGATESTAFALTSGLMLLAQQPELLQRLRDQPDAMHAFVEETLRLYPPNMLLANKMALADCRFCDVDFAAGERVIVPLAAPNRDPRVFANPDAVDLTRPPLRHFTFSLGQHFCLGQALARNQLRTFFELLAQRVQRVEMDIAQPQLLPYTAVNRWRELPLRLIPR